MEAGADAIALRYDSMPLTISVVSQKGGVGKSALARSLAVLVARGGLRVLLADLDFQQSTALEWARLRESYGHAPPVAARRFRSAEDALIAGAAADVLIIDGPARTSAGTLELALQSDLVVQPSGCGLDDLRPAVLLFHELLGAGIGRERLLVALCRTGSGMEEGAGRRYLQKAKYEPAGTSIPERVAYRDALNRGCALIESADSKLNAIAQALMDEVLKKVRVGAGARGSHRRKEQAR
jgi:chromosome partitioning protein